MISVIIPVYNVENYLHVCINSILNQTFPDFEVICIDDASSDSSLEILEYFSLKDSRVKILKNNSNKGPGYSRNRGLDIAKGEYVSFLDSDDFLSPNAFEILVKKAKSNCLDVLLFKNVVIYDENKEFGMESYYDMKYMDDFINRIFNHWDLDKTKFFVMSTAPWNKFYLKSFLDKNNLRFTNKNLIHEDDPFFYKVMTSAQRISIIDDYLHNRRRRKGSIMTLSNERVFDNIDISYDVLDIFFEKKVLYEYYKKELLNYIFEVLFHVKYNKIEDTLKKEFFIKIQEACKVFIEKYGIYKDIKELVNPIILEFFKFDNLVDDDRVP